MKTRIKSFIQDIRYIRYEIYKRFNNQDNLEYFPVKFVIFSGARSGSTLLCSLLNSHPEVLCHYELFNDKKIYYGKDISKDIGISTIKERDRNPELFLAKLWQYTFEKSALGFKILSGQNPTAVSLMIKDKGIRKILLVRNNQIKSYVSMQIARNTKKWCVSRKDKSQEQESQRVSVKVNINKLYTWIQNHEQYYESIRQKLKNSQQSFLEMSYEDLVGDNDELVKSRVLEFIGVSVQPHILQANIKKQNSDQLTDLVSNFDELEKKLRGTRLAPLLYS